MKLSHSMCVVPAMVLAACGGGGGGGGDDGGGGGTGGGQTPAVESTLVVSGGNAKPAAADALDAATNGTAAGASAGLVTGVQVSPAAGGAVTPSLSSVAFKLATLAANRPAVAVGAVISPRTETCEMGGTITVSGNLSGGSSLVAGDSLDLITSNCMVNLASGMTTLNGKLRIAVASGTFNPASTSYPKAITLRLTATNLSIVTGPDVTNVTTGDMKIELNQTSASHAFTTLSGKTLTNTWSHDSVSRSSSLRGYRVQQESFDSQIWSDIQASVVVTNPRIGTDVVYQLSTPTRLVTDYSLVLRGSIKVTGVKSGLLLTVAEIGRFDLQVDADGDGTYATSTAVGDADLRDLL
jgi:hypothetical protein